YGEAVRVSRLAGRPVNTGGADRPAVDSDRDIGGFPRRVEQPEHLPPAGFVQARLDAVVGKRHAWIAAGPIEYGSEVAKVVRLAAGEVADAGVRTDQQGAAFAEVMFDDRDPPVAEAAQRTTALQRIGLEEAAAAHGAAGEIEGDAIADIGHEFHLVLAHAEDGVEAVVGLDGADLAAIAEIAGRSLRDQGTPLLYPVPQRLG